MKIASRKEHNVPVLDIGGELVLGEPTRALRDCARELVDSGESFVIFNMAEVTCLDSAGIGEIVACHKRARDRGGQIRLVVTGKSRELLLLYELNKIIEMFEEIGPALADFPP